MIQRQVLMTFVCLLYETQSRETVLEIYDFIFLDNLTRFVFQL